MTSGMDIDRVARLIAEIAAEEIMPRFGQLAAGDCAPKRARRSGDCCR